MGLWLIIIGLSLVSTLCLGIYFHKVSPEWKIRNIATFTFSAVVMVALLGGLCILAFSQSSNIPIVSDKKIPIDLSVRKFHLAARDTISIVYDDAEPTPVMLGLFSVYPTYPVHFDSIYFDTDTPYYRQIIRERPRTFFRFSEGSVENILHLPKTAGIK